MVMDKELYKAYLRTPEWKAIRLDILHLRNHKCERCDSTYRLEVHHKTYRNLFNESPKDLELLCHTCHKNHHKVQDNKPKRKQKHPGRRRRTKFVGKEFAKMYAR